MSCPSCHQEPSFLRVAFTSQGVSFVKSIKGYSRCEHCGQLLKLSNLRLSVIAQTIAGVTAVGLYALLFRSIGLWIGFTNAAILFFPYLLITGVTTSYITTTKFGKFIVVTGQEETSHNATENAT